MEKNMKRYHLKKMSDLLETLEIVSNNAKNKGHRSGFRCHELAKQLADQFQVFLPTLDTIVKNKEVNFYVVQTTKCTKTLYKTGTIRPI